MKSWIDLGGYRAVLAIKCQSCANNLAVLGLINDTRGWSKVADNYAFSLLTAGSTVKFSYKCDSA